MEPRTNLTPEQKKRKRTPRAQLYVVADGQPLRLCTKCSVHLPLTDFHDSALAVSVYTCKACTQRKNQVRQQTSSQSDLWRARAHSRPAMVQANYLRNKKALASSSRSGGMLSVSDVGKALEFWGPKCFWTGREDLPLGFVVVDPSEPSTWQNVVPVIRAIARANGFQLPDVPDLRDKWRAALAAAAAAAAAPELGTDTIGPSARGDGRRESAA